MEYKSIGKKIREFRKKKKMRQEDLAEKADLSVNYVGQIERGEKVPALASFVSIANALEVSADVLLSDILITGYEVKKSLLNEKIEQLSPEDLDIVCDFANLLIRRKNSGSKNKAETTNS